MYRKSIFTVVGVVVLLGSASAVFGVDGSDGVFITLTRSAEPLDKQPANVSVIGQDKIRNSSAKTAVELLRGEKGITVRDYYANGTKAEVDMRGFGETGASNNVVLVNGRRVNQIDMSNVDWTQIPVDQIERIEIVNGGGGVLYGDNAVGGVINIITKTGSGEKPLEVGASGGSFNSMKTTLSYGKTGSAFSYTVRANRFSSDGFRENNKFSANDFGVNSEFAAGKRASLVVAGSFHNDEFGMPGALSQADWDAGNIGNAKNPNDAVKSVDYFIQPVLKFDAGGAGRAEAELSFRNRVQKNDFVPLMYDTRDIATTAASLRFFRTDEPFSKKNILTAGGDLYNSKHGISNFALPDRTTSIAKNDISKDSLGIYFDDRISLLEKVVAGAGLRTEAARYSFSDPMNAVTDTSNLASNAYNLDLNWFYSGNSSAKISYSKGFRTPKTDEYYTFNPVTFAVTGWNKNLKIQENTETNLNLRHYLGKKDSISLTAYQLNVINELFYNPATFSNENYGKTIRRGIELGAEVLLIDRVKLTAAYTYVNAKFDGGMYDGKDVVAVPENRTKLNASIRPLGALELNLSDVNVSRQRFINDEANASGWLDGYNVLDITAFWKVSGLTLFAGVNNLTDTKYTDYGVIGSSGKNYYPAPGRNVTTGVNVTF
jgi:iron complex outermembrane receptor protein